MSKKDNRIVMLDFHNVIGCLQNMADNLKDYAESLSVTADALEAGHNPDPIRPKGYKEHNHRINRIAPSVPALKKKGVKVTHFGATEAKSRYVRLVSQRIDKFKAELLNDLTEWSLEH